MASSASHQYTLPRPQKLASDACSCFDCACCCVTMQLAARQITCRSKCSSCLHHCFSFMRFCMAAPVLFTLPFTAPLNTLNLRRNQARGHERAPLYDASMLPLDDQLLRTAAATVLHTAVTFTAIQSSRFNHHRRSHASSSVRERMDTAASAIPIPA